jgi:hypothetical protein
VSWSIPSALVKILTRICALAVPEVRDESVTMILEGRGIKYRHRNDDILAPNSIEEQQMKKARKVRYRTCGAVRSDEKFSSFFFNLGKAATRKECQGTRGEFGARI